MVRFLPLVVAALLAGQTPPQQPSVTFKVEVNYVEIDAVVTDAQGNFVSGLTKEDFQVIEEGKPQSVTTFTLVNIPVRRADPPLYRGAVVEPDTASNRAEFNGRVFVIVLDDLWTAPARTRPVRAAAAQFVRRFVGANDIAAVVMTGGGARAGQEFTGSHARLVAAIDRFVGRNGGDTDQEATFRARSTYATLSGLAEYLGGIRGRRKAIVWFGEGIDYNVDDVFTSPNADVVRQEMQNAIAAATRANVAYYGVDARGVGAGLDQAVTETGTLEGMEGKATVNVTQGMKGTQDALRRAHNSLRTLSVETGGFAIVNRNDLNAAFQQIVQENSSYYVLGYYSNDERRDGRFRNVQVKVTRPGLKVTARKGYIAPKGKPANTPPPSSTEASPALRDALASPIPSSGLGMTVAVAPFFSGGAKASIAVTVEFDPARLKLVEQGGTFNADLEVVMFALDGGNRSVDGARDLAPLRLSQRTYEAVREHGFRMQRRLQLPPGRYQMRVGAREGNSGAVGSLAMDLDVPDFTKGGLQMSGLAIASAAASRIPTANADPAFKDVLPSAPTAQREFPAGDTLALYADIYDNMAATPHKVAITSTLTADDGAVAFTNSDERSSADLGGKSGAHGYAVTVPLKGLAPGRYVLKVEARALVSEGATASRDVEIRIR